VLISCSICAAAKMAPTAAATDFLTGSQAPNWSSSPSLRHLRRHDHRVAVPLASKR
jgi:hypothetical protein